MTTTRFIAKCRYCKAHSSTLATNVNRADAEMGSLFRDDSGESGTYGGFAIKCRACGKAAPAREVRGVLKPSKLCNAKCLASHGPVCECSCGGKNHGASYSAA